MGRFADRTALITGAASGIAPPRFLLFIAIAVIGAPIGGMLIGWRVGLLAAFDVAALVFLASTVPLLREASADAMRTRAKANDANRTEMLFVAAAAMLAVLIAVMLELGDRVAPTPVRIVMVIGTLVIAWCFTNMVYALHYAHLYYLPDEGGGDTRGLEVPGTDEPDYWDFVYFAFTLGMTFQTSDVVMQTGRFRRVATFHSIAAFVFNLGVVAFTVNVLGG